MSNFEPTIHMSPPPLFEVTSTYVGNNPFTPTRRELLNNLQGTVLRTLDYTHVEKG